MMVSWTAEVLAVQAGIVQALGYALYVRYVVRERITPNPTSWLMFAYGTSVLVLVEYAIGASWRELALPGVCAACAVAVAGICAFRRQLGWPEDNVERWAFLSDVALTVGYVGAWALSRAEAIGEETRQVANVALLIGLNATTITSFIPILRSTWREPFHERPEPWLVWTLAYGLLLLTTLWSGGHPALLIYPVLAVLMHGCIGVLAVGRHRHKRDVGVYGDLEVAPAGKLGLGVYVRRAFGRDEVVFTATGTVRHYESRTLEDAFRYTDWLGVGEDTYLDMAKPFVFVNHSCEPNLGIRGALEFVALRDIEVGEQLSYDYSLTSNEPFEMICRCGAPSCRRVIRRIQDLSPEVFRAALPYVNPYFQQVYREHGEADEKVEALA